MCLDRHSRSQIAEVEVQEEENGRPQQIPLLWSLFPILSTVKG